MNKRFATKVVLVITSVLMLTMVGTSAAQPNDAGANIVDYNADAPGTYDQVISSGTDLTKVSWSSNTSYLIENGTYSHSADDTDRTVAVVIDADNVSIYVEDNTTITSSTGVSNEYSGFLTFKGDNVSMISLSPQGATIDYDAGDWYPAVEIEGTGASLVGFDVNQTRGSGGSELIAVRASEVSIEHNHIHADDEAGIKISNPWDNNHPWAPSETDSNTSNVTVENNLIEDLDVGIVVTNVMENEPVSGTDYEYYQGTVKNLSLMSNTLDNNGLGFFVNSEESGGTSRDAGTPQNVSVSHNEILNGENGVLVDLIGNADSFDTGQLDIEKNDIVNNSVYGVSNDVSGVLDATNNWWGDSSGPSGSGDSVSENVAFSPWLENRVGTNPRAIISPVTDLSTVDWKSGTNYLLENGTYSHAEDDTDSQVAIVVDSDNVSIYVEDNTEITSSTGIDSAYSGFITFKGDNVSMCSQELQGATIDYDAGDWYPAVEIEGTGAELMGFDLTQTRGSGGSEIVAIRASEVSVEYNHIHADDEAGIKISNPWDNNNSWTPSETDENTENVTIANNLIENLDVGIVVTNVMEEWSNSEEAYQGTVKNLYVMNNLIDNNDKGIFINSEETGGTSRDAGTPQNVSVSHNEIMNSENGVLVDLIGNADSFDTGQLDIEKNDIVNNSVYGVSNDVSGVLDATNNWWGDSSGPSGSGDSVSENVAFSPWLENEIGVDPMTFAVDNVGPEPDNDYIGTAVLGANPNDEVRVREGTYYENNKGSGFSGAISLLIDVENLTVESLGSPSNTIINAQAPHGVGAIGDGVELEGFTVENTPEGETMAIGVGGNRSVVRNNIIPSNNGGMGIRLGNARDVFIENNQVTGVPLGLWIKNSEYISAYSNEIWNCSTGSLIEHSERVSLQGNFIENNVNGIGTKGMLSDIALNNNFINANDNFGVGNDNENALIDATNNWWGDSSGPGGVASGTGDNVIGNVEYHPWMEFESPSVSIDSPSEGDSFSTSSVTVDFTRSDVGTGIDNYEFRVDSGSWTEVSDNSISSYEFTGLSDGDRTLQVKAIDYAGNENTDNVTVNVDTSVDTGPEPADFTVSNLEVSPSMVEPGEDVDISAEITNDGGESGSVTVEFLVDGSVEEDEEISLDAGNTTTVDYVTSRDSTDNYDVTIDAEDDSVTGTFSVVEHIEPEFDVENVSVSPQVINPGEAVEISANVVNIGNENGQREVELTVNGGVEDSSTLTLASGESDSLNFSVPIDEKGDYDVTVDVEDDSATGSFTVEIPEAPGSEELEGMSSDSAAQTIAQSEPESAAETMENMDNENGGRIIDNAVNQNFENEMADIMTFMDSSKSAGFLSSADSESSSKVVSSMADQEQVEILDNILKNMSEDDLNDTFGAMEEEDRENLVTQLSDDVVNSLDSDYVPSEPSEDSTPWGTVVSVIVVVIILVGVGYYWRVK